MKTYELDSPVVIFHHKEYGHRLLFQQGITNPRNTLGKNGVTVHLKFSSLFHQCLRIRADVIDGMDNVTNREFYINRKSLIKFLGEEANHLHDDDLFKYLKSHLWQEDYNEGEIPRKVQIEAGKRINHAGAHNQHKLKHTKSQLGDKIKGNFLNWLYEKTILGTKRIKLRFLLVGKEKALLDAGEVLAIKRFEESYQHVPAYTTHIKHFKPDMIDIKKFEDIPKTSKNNYIKAQEYDSETHFDGKYPKISKTDTSTGTSGKPTEWVRGAKELLLTKKSMELGGKIEFGKRSISYINTFAFGPWATGLTVYELMRDTGSVFATGPDKEKILDKLNSIFKYEKHHFELAMHAFLSKHPGLDEEDLSIIANFIDTSLIRLLKEKNLKINHLFHFEHADALSSRYALIRRYKSDIRTIIKKLNSEKVQIIIAGYPPFLKDLISYAEEKGIDFQKFSIIGIVGGQAISEAMRDQLIKRGFFKIYSSYGASDLDINVGVETDFEITIRKAIEKNPGLARELLGENQGNPAIFHVDPFHYHIEEAEDNQLLFTCTTERSSPRIRYDLEDKGKIRAASDVQASLAKYGIFIKPRTNLPLLFIWGRESTVVFNGANLSFTELERAITLISELEPIVLKKAFYTYLNDEGGEELEIWLELEDGIELPNEKDMLLCSQTLLSTLASINQDFRYQLEKLDEGTLLPIVRFFKRNQSPIAEAHGHRKQVLIFQKEINLPKDYEFPDEENCKAAHVFKEDSLHIIPLM